jgi:2-desacetyl-2-hydroxyethyl bacteriochlorophyllide A dehydrogenase
MIDFELLGGTHRAAFPLTPGHEYCGVVDKVGSNTDAAWLGRRVVADNELTCLKCSNCRRGQWRCCAEYRQFGFGPPGGYAEYVLAPIHNLHPLADTISFEQGALLEPLGVALAATSMGKTHLGSTSAILGAGPIGLNCLAVLKASGARRIVCLDKRKMRLARAKSWGTLETAEDPQDFKKLSTGLHPFGANVVIEATGDVNMIPLGISSTRFGGCFVLAGFYKHCALQFGPDSILGRNIRFLGAGTNCGFIEPAADAVADGVLSTQGMITHRFRLEDYARAFSEEQIAAPDYVKGIFIL